jgi:anti-anti-sigma factor
MIETTDRKRKARIVLEGDLDAAAVEELRPRVRRLLSEGSLRFTFDFRQVQFMCSAGLALLVEVYNAVVDRGGTVGVENLTPRVKALLAETKLLRVFLPGPAEQQHPASTPALRQEMRLEALAAVQKYMSQELIFLSYINRITSEVLKAQVSEDMYALALEGILRSLKCSTGFLALISEGEAGPDLRLVACEGLANEIRPRINGLALGPESLEGLCCARLEVRAFGPDTGEDQPASPLLEATGVDCGILAPMAGREGAFGLVLIQAMEDPSSFFPHSAPLIQAFANVCGLAIEKMRLLEDIQHKNACLTRTLAELNRTQDSLMEAGKLAVVGALAQGLGHALNNKLVPILGYAEMLGLETPPDSSTSDKIGVIGRSAQDILKIVDNLHSLTRRESLKIETHDLGEIIDLSLSILDYMFRDQEIRVHRVYDGVDARVRVDRSQMTQAFLALFHRLPEAFADVEERTLRIEIERTDDEILVRTFDNGSPISPKELETIHDPLAMYADPLSRDLLNLATVNTIVKSHKGTLEVASSKQTGTCVTLRIPSRLGGAG